MHLKEIKAYCANCTEQAEFYVFEVARLQHLRNLVIRGQFPPTTPPDITREIDLCG